MKKKNDLNLEEYYSVNEEIEKLSQSMADEINEAKRIETETTKEITLSLLNNTVDILQNLCNMVEGFADLKCLDEKVINKLHKDIAKKREQVVDLTDSLNETCEKYSGDKLNSKLAQIQKNALKLNNDSIELSSEIVVKRMDSVFENLAKGLANLDTNESAGPTSGE